MKNKYLSLFCFLLVSLICVTLANRSSYPCVSNHAQLLSMSEDELDKLSLNSILNTLSPLTQSDKHIQALIKSSNTYPSAKIILAKPDAYPNSLIELAAKKPETISFVAYYPKYATDDAAILATSMMETYTSFNIPLYLQWDFRWGYEKYGEDFLAINGCGPTCLSMVLAKLTGNTEWTPKAVADFSYNSGYLVKGVGTSWALMTEGANTLGIYGETIPLEPSIIHELLENGFPLIASMRAGHFTTKGHFIVLTGIDENGQIHVNDPDSLIRSQQTWDLDLILSEAKNMWAFYPQ